MLTGLPPFDRPTPMGVIIAHSRDDVTPPSRFQADVPADLEAIILRCLAKRPEDRFQNADSLEQALSECAAADRWTQTDAARWWHEHEHESETLREMSATVTM
jgi:serine/threonine-protein kinase